ncbi:unnamed protein product [Rotaria magnacalcarata]|uniref:Glycosyltransferase family 92 protein n=3 Tax=Rotaria magnacalcarata TaxID=392030 RepID=A0A814X630_9BILA|nr:unnamed protein product [Rotaria magnacalcarata]CAF2127550.1 unnamed protein product [Rotaria magnacalcarata]CAF3809360.1 unnamed protein product [Rotaria magnacalcarata]CAF4032204.1 unnamed protein product [Rotaria magnacalcarata]
MSTNLHQTHHIHVILFVVIVSIIIIGINRIPIQRQFLSICTIHANSSNTTTYPLTSRYAYYVCTQVWNETSEHMTEWIEHQIFRLGFRNICMISVEQPLNKTLVTRYHLATITKMARAQEWKYCLECFTDPPMQPQDILMIQDIDEFLNVQRSDAVSALYDSYDMFHFTDLRYGYVYEKDEQLKGKSLLATNVYRRQNTDLGEYMHPKFEQLFVGCNDTCYTTNGKVSVLKDLLEQ